MTLCNFRVQTFRLFQGLSSQFFDAARLQLLDTVRNASMESDNFTLSSLTVAAEWRSPDIARGITQW